MKAKLTFAFTAITFIAVMNTHKAQAQQLNWRTAGNNVADGHRLGANNNRSLIVVTNSQERMRIDSIGNVGIGVETPEGKLHVFRGSAGLATANANAPLVVENSTSNFINLLTPNANERGILFGDNLNAQDGGIIYGNASLPDGMQFRTNGNVTRMSLTSAGNLGVGTSLPEGNLHVFRGSAGLATANANAPLVVENSTSNFINLLTPNANERGILFGDNLNAQDGGIIYGNASLPDGMQFRTNGNVTRMSLTSSGNLGVGTPSPEANLHVLRGSAGIITANSNAPLVVENSTSAYVNLLVPSTTESGVLFGDNLNAQDGGIIYSNGSAVNGMQFRTNGNVTRMTLTAGGNLGIGADPGSFKSKVSHGSFGFDIEDAGTGDDWELVSLSGGNLDLFFNGTFKGTFSSVDGVYTPGSDQRLKTNIQPMSSVLKKINELRPVNYQMKNTKGEMSTGFIAQEVLKVFPSLVIHNESKERGLDLYSLNYTGLGVVAIKGIQELQQIVEEQKKAIESLKETVTALQHKISASESPTFSSTNNAETISKTNIAITDVQIEQNKPNPFAHSTSIKYSIPAGVKNAQLIITNSLGKTVKQISLKAGIGVVNLDASTLASGTYNYTLLTDGKTIETRKMVVTH